MHVAIMPAAGRAGSMIPIYQPIPQARPVRRAGCLRNRMSWLPVGLKRFAGGFARQNPYPIWRASRAIYEPYPDEARKVRD